MVCVLLLTYEWKGTKLRDNKLYMHMSARRHLHIQTALHDER